MGELKASVFGPVRSGNDPFRGDILKRPITLDLSRTDFGVISRHTLLGRQTSDPQKFAPFFLESRITNVASAVYTIAASEIKKFKLGDQVTYWDVSGGAFYTETKTITSEPDTVNNTVELDSAFSAAPNTSEDTLVLADGTQLSKDVVILIEDVDFADADRDPVVVAVYDCPYVDINQVLRATRFDLTKVTGRRLNIAQP